MLQSVLDCVALSLPSWLWSNQSSIALIAPYCVKFFDWDEAFQAKTLYDPLFVLQQFVHVRSFVLCSVFFWWGWGKKPRVIKDLRTPDVGGFAWLWSWDVLRNFVVRGLLLYPVWLGNTLCVPVCWVYTSFSRQEHSFSDKSLETTIFDAKSRKAWTLRMDNGFNMIYQCWQNLSCWKRRQSGT